jgi:hypothetical protein
MAQAHLRPATHFCRVEMKDFLSEKVPAVAAKT